MEEKKKERKQKNKEKGNGQGTLYFSETLQKWVGQYHEKNGKRKTLTQRKNEKVGDFKKRFNNILTSLDNGTYIEKSEETFISILERHIEQKYTDGITSDSGYLRDLKTVVQIKKTCSNFIEKPIQKIKTEEIEDCKKEIRQYAQTSIDKIWRLLNKTFKIAMSRRKIIYNPMDTETLTKPISVKEIKKVEALTISEQKKLENVLDSTERDHKYRNAVKLQLLTGMRIGEVLARSKKDVDFKNNTFLINSTLTHDKNGKTILGEHTKTYNKRTGIDLGKRTLTLTPEIKEVLQEQLKQRIINNIYQLIFWDYDNNTFVSYNELNSWLSRLNEKYKISKNSISTHVLRHTAITRWREKGMDMKVIQYLAGHVEGSSITDDVYVSVSEDFIKQELKKIQ